MQKPKEVVHFVPQTDQPYGSKRLSCVRCGVHVIGGIKNHTYTNSQYEWDNLTKIYDFFVQCDGTLPTDLDQTDP